MNYFFLFLSLSFGGPWYKIPSDVGPRLNPYKCDVFFTFTPKSNVQCQIWSTINIGKNIQQCHQMEKEGHDKYELNNTKQPYTETVMVAYSRTQSITTWQQCRGNYSLHARLNDQLWKKRKHSAMLSDKTEGQKEAYELDNKNAQLNASLWRKLVPYCWCSLIMYFFYLFIHFCPMSNIL